MIYYDYTKNPIFSKIINMNENINKKEDIISALKDNFKRADIFGGGKVIEEGAIPRREMIISCFEDFTALLFLMPPKRDNNASCEQRLACAAELLKKEVKKAFCLFCGDKTQCASCEIKAGQYVEEFLSYLPVLQDLALGDLRAAYEGDPAAANAYEILLCYPGPRAVELQRMAHFFYQKKVPLLPRILTEYAHTKTGIDINPGARIGKNFFIDHGTGVVIGETSVIGDNVKIYQGVTLGARSFPLDENGNPQKGIKRHPEVGDNVTIYAGATILGAIKIGANSTIAANAWITEDVPPNTVCKKLLK